MVSSIVSLHLAANLIWIFGLSGKRLILLLKHFYLNLKRGKGKNFKILKDEE